MKSKQIEYCVWETATAWRVWICENSIRISERWFYTIDDLLQDAAKFHLNNPKAYIGIELDTGSIVNLVGNNQ